MGLEGEVAVTTGDLLALLGVNAVPSAAFVSADGRVVAVAEGTHAPEFFLETIETRFRPR